MIPKVGEIYNIKKSLLKYRYCCDYVRVNKINKKTITLDVCYLKENLIYIKPNVSKKRIYKEAFEEEVLLKKIKLV